VVDLRARDYDPGVGRFTSRDPISTYVGRTDTVSPYSYGNNDPVNSVDPTGESALAASIGSIIGAVLNAILAPVQLTAAGCKKGGQNDISRHQKDFQGVTLCTRGYISGDCLAGRNWCLNALWNSHQPERAGQSVAINQLNRIREDWWDGFKDNWLSGATAISPHVDWEVGPGGSGGTRRDIMTDEQNLYEVKRYHGPSTTAEVDEQLFNYTLELWALGVWNVRNGTELQDWADTFIVFEKWYQFGTFGGKEVVVWGLGLPPGHVYMDDSDRVDSKVRAKAKRQHAENQDSNDCDCGNQNGSPFPLPGGGSGDPAAPDVPEVPEIPEVPILV
jgi:hypothetical protein